MKKISSKKLSLDAQTLRNISVSDLDQAAGAAIGSFVYCSSACATGQPGCSAACTSNAHLTCR